MYCVMIRARPDYSAEDDADEWAGAYANCYIEFPDSRGAEVLARWYLADVGFIPECVLQMRTVDPEDVDEDVAAYIREAQTDGYSLVIHEWPEGAEDARRDDADDWDPPGEAEQRLAAIAGSYIEEDSEQERVLHLRSDRHFGWGREQGSIRGTWHVSENELTLAYFPAEGKEKAILDGPWRVAPGFLIGTGMTMRRETNA